MVVARLYDQMKLLPAIICVVGLASIGPAAQIAPDFSGTWSMDLTRSESAAQGTPIVPVTVEIRQMSVVGRMETTRNGRTESVRCLPASANATGAGELLGAFRLNGQKLATTLVTYIIKQAITVKEVRSLDPGGREMSVEVSIVV